MVLSNLDQEETEDYLATPADNFADTDVLVSKYVKTAKVEEQKAKKLDECAARLAESTRLEEQKKSEAKNKMTTFRAKISSFGKPSVLLEKLCAEKNIGFSSLKEELVKFWIILNLKQDFYTILNSERDENILEVPILIIIND